ncbi:MAG: amidohydrolase family protein [Akkermansiaceae bacterium]|nr:amidohydrolase family protein [Akkermansiaceae bacterium]
MSERIDSHHHLWAINDTDYVWMGEEHGVIRRDFLGPEMKAAFTEGGVNGSVAVQARQMVEETEFLLDLAEDHKEILGVVGWVPLRENAGEPHLERLAAHSKLKGVRHVVHDEPDDDFILGKAFNEGIARLKTYGLLYDILIFYKHLPQTIEFVDRHPEQAFVVDHIAKPRIAKGVFDQEWADGMKQLAKREHVSCKVSGMLTEVRDEDWDLELIQPYFDTVLEAFGPKRVMFGSDWPVLLLRDSYGTWTEVADQLSAFLSKDEQAAFWGGNARRIYGL